MKTYTPISCSMYDELEHLASFNETVELVYQMGEQQHVLATQIATIVTENKVEYLITTDQHKIRLDDLITVNGKHLLGACSF